LHHRSNSPTLLFLLPYITCSTVLPLLSFFPFKHAVGALLRRQGDEHDLSVAVGLLTDALRYEPHNHVGWFNLGMARKAQGHTEEGEKHLFTAVTLAAAAPVLSYSDLPLGI
jgi:hypothetical protein